jgi:hypothetical protein
LERRPFNTLIPMKWIDAMATATVRQHPVSVEDHRPNRFLEIAPAVDRPHGVRPNGFMGGIDHGFGRLCQRLQRRQGEAPISSGISLKVRALKRGRHRFPPVLSFWLSLALRPLLLITVMPENTVLL